MNLPKASEVVIIGGGFIGTSVAYQLAKRGIEVTVVEQNTLACQGSGANWGFIWIQTHPAGWPMDLALASNAMYENLSDELGCDIEYVRCGGMMPVEKEEDLERAQERVEQQKKEAGVDVRLLSGIDIRQMEPALSRTLVGAVYSPLDGKVNPFYLTLGLAEAAKKKGTKIFGGTRVRAIEVERKEIQSVVTDQGKIATKIIVNAAGPWARKIGSMVGIEVPIVAHRGEVIITEPLPPLFSQVAYSGSYLRGHIWLRAGVSSEDYRDDPLWYYGVRQHANGNISVGSGTGIRDYVGFDKTCSYERIKELAEWGMRIIPTLRNVSIIRMHAGLKATSLSPSSGGLILDKVEFRKGCMVVVVDTGHAVARCPIVGKLAAELITAGRGNTSIPIDKCGLTYYKKEVMITEKRF